jgi:hypothetical protein
MSTDSDLDEIRSFLEGELDIGEPNADDDYPERVHLLGYTQQGRAMLCNTLNAIEELRRLRGMVLSLRKWAGSHEAAVNDLSGIIEAGTSLAA